MLSFSYVHISVHLVSTELVFSDKCFAIFFVSFAIYTSLFLRVFYLFLTGIFNIEECHASDAICAHRLLENVSVFLYIFVNRMNFLLIFYFSRVIGKKKY